MQGTIPMLSNAVSIADAESGLPVGARVADFEIVDIIGEGGFGILYLAFDHLLQRIVAIKEYMPMGLAGRGADNSVTVRTRRDQKIFETGLKSFINEARLLAKFDHPALVKVYRFWEENNTGYMAMRYYEGQTLKKMISSNPALITEAWLKSMLKPLLEALDALHRARILHRDISPDNIMIQPAGGAVLLDLGAARQSVGEMSQTLTVILKPNYAPAEQYAADAAMAQGPWTDIYSLSAVIYLAITKKPPPTSVARMIKDPIELLQNGGYSGFSKEFLSAIDRGLAVRPEDRPQSIEEFSKLLQLELALPGQPNSAVIPTLPGFPAGIVSATSGKPDVSSSMDDSAAEAPYSMQATRRKAFARLRKLWILVGLCVIGMGGYVSLAPKTVPTAVPVASPANASGSALKQVLSPPSNAITQASTRDVAQLKASASMTAENAAPPKSSINTASRSSVAKSSGSRATGTVRLKIKPWGSISIDGVSKGLSPPLKKLALAEGRHEIRIMNPNFPIHTIEMDISKNSTGSIEHDFSPLKK